MRVFAHFKVWRAFRPSLTDQLEKERERRGVRHGSGSFALKITPTGLRRDCKENTRKTTALLLCG
jgi:hypothetical protein